MVTLLFKLAAIVMFVFLLIASLAADATFAGEIWIVWLACGLLSAWFAMFFAPWVDAQLNSQRPPAPPA